MPSTVSALRAVCTVFAVLGGLLLGAGSAHGQTIEEVTDDYLFTTSLPEFVEIRSAAPYPDQLDWASDACSWSPDEPLGFDFTPACYRHDFGYRNYKRQGRFNEDTRLTIDDNFYADLKVICAGNYTCNGTAWTYYRAVRQFGASATSTADALRKAEVRKAEVPGARRAAG
ncbi:MAG: phospholipase [Pseudonocardiaceae bacterium]|nr:phospholipase [Pseudonocardiaceae bacterium]